MWYWMYISDFSLNIMLPVREAREVGKTSRKKSSMLRAAPHLMTLVPRHTAYTKYTNDTKHRWLKTFGRSLTVLGPSTLQHTLI